MIAKQGVRLVRGEAWNSPDNDGGEGGLGTIVHLQNNADKTIATVVWDNGMKYYYEIGQGNSRELLVHDPKQNGRNYGRSCHECKKDIIGSLWNCVICANVDLCTQCYMEDAHEVTHVFRRMSNHACNWVMLPRRSCSRKVTSMGFFPGATVERNTKLQNTRLHNTCESSEECFGRIINYESEVGTSFSAVYVVWNPNFRQAVYQLGRDGKVEIRCTVYGYGPSYYVEHLPALIHSPELERKPRGKTVCQLPLYGGAQHVSLNTNHSYTSGDIIEPSSNFFYNSKTRNHSHLTYHKYTTSSVVDTIPINGAANYKNKQASATQNAIKPSATIEEEENYTLNWKQYSSNEVTGMDDLQQMNKATGFIALYGSARSLDSDWSLKTNPSVTTVGTMVRNKAETTSNVNSICNVGDCVKIKREATTMKSLPNQYIGEAGQLQYIDEWGLCAVQFACDKRILRLPVDSLIKADFTEERNGKGIFEERHAKSQISNQEDFNMAMKDKNIIQKHISMKSELQDQDTCKNFDNIKSNLSLNEAQRVSQKASSVTLTDSVRTSESRGASCSSDENRLPKLGEASLCCLCREHVPDIKFEPCGHQVTCSKCSSYFKKCLICKVQLTIKGSIKKTQFCLVCNVKHPIRFLPCSHILACKGSGAERKAGLRTESLQRIIKRMERLGCRVNRLECSSRCQLCSRNRKNVFFQCGHSTCETCSDRLMSCPTCHREIEVKTVYG